MTPLCGATKLLLWRSGVHRTMHKGAFVAEWSVLSHGVAFVAERSVLSHKVAFVAERSVLSHAQICVCGGAE